MKYKVRRIDDEFIQEKGLSKSRLEKEMQIVKNVIGRTPFHCCGVVVAGETRHKWRYCHSVWLGDDLYILKTVYLKKPDTTAAIIAIIEEDRSESDGRKKDGYRPIEYVHNAGVDEYSGASVLESGNSDSEDSYSGDV